MKAAAHLHCVFSALARYSAHALASMSYEGDYAERSTTLIGRESYSKSLHFTRNEWRKGREETSLKGREE